MNEIVIKTSTRETCTVILQENALAHLAKYVGTSPFYLTDENVFRLYGAQIEKALPTAQGYTMSAGEAFKTPETLFKLLEAMAGAGLTKRSALVAVGGGVVGDLGGLAASLYMRGMPFVFVPTTLLADVDAAIGGKTAIDFCGVKNLLGTIRQPQTVLVDPSFLCTLPRRELVCGLGEIVKHAALLPSLFDRLCSCDGAFFDLDFLAGLIPENLRLKTEIVSRDPTDADARKRLNLGHTTAHAIELFKSGLSHGECVLLGIFYEAELAKRYLGCDGEYLARLQALCMRISEVEPKEIDVASCSRLARLDKKNPESGKIALVVPTKKGECAMLELPFEEYEGTLAAIRSAL